MTPHDDDLARNKCNFSFKIVSNVEDIICSELKVIVAKSHTILLTAMNTMTTCRGRCPCSTTVKYLMFTSSHQRYLRPWAAPPWLDFTPLVSLPYNVNAARVPSSKCAIRATTTTCHNEHCRLPVSRLSQNRLGWREVPSTIIYRYWLRCRMRHLCGIHDISLSRGIHYHWFLWTASSQCCEDLGSRRPCSLLEC